MYISSKDHLDCQTAVIIVSNNCPHPGPVILDGKTGHGLSLVDVAGNGPEEVRILKPVAETGTAGEVAYLVRNTDFVFT